MPEQLDLTDPVVFPSTTRYEVIYVCLDKRRAHIAIRVEDEAGRARDFVYSGAEATTLMRQLNKADLSVKSLERRILERLVADGLLAGTISGAPD